MKYRIAKWTVLVVTIIVVLLAAVECFSLYEEQKSPVYNTPFGKIDISTSQVAMIDYYTTEPHISYIIHKDVVQKTDSLLKVTVGDTIWYCLTPETVRYYLVKKDSIGKFQIWEWSKYNNVAWPEVTKQFKQEHILIK